MCTARSLLQLHAPHLFFERLRDAVHAVQWSLYLQRFTFAGFQLSVSGLAHEMAGCSGSFSPCCNVLAITEQLCIDYHLDGKAMFTQFRDRMR
jgi:hypothetical protein